MNITELITDKQNIENLREDEPQKYDMRYDLLFSEKEVTEQGLLVVPAAFDFNDGK